VSVAAYVRVRSKSQDTAMPRAAIERAATARGDTVALWFSEQRSGRTIARPELDRLRQAAREGHFRKLYVFRLDRLNALWHPRHARSDRRIPGTRMLGGLDRGRV